MIHEAEMPLLVQLPQDVRDVPVHGVLADDELGCDLSVAPACRDECEHLTFTSREGARDA